MLSGKQGGKTSFAPWWLWREIQHPERGGSGDYIAATSTYDLFKLKMLPELRICFEQILGVGRYWSGDRIIELRDPDTGRFWAKRADDPMWGRVVLRSAQASGGLEAATAKAAWLDECVAPETLVSTEHGDIPIARIVQERMRVRVWSYDTEQNKWELRPITKWVCLPQHQELVQLGDLWLTANHRIWTRDDGYMPIAHFCHSCYNVVSGGQKHYDKVHAMQCRVDRTTKKVLQPQMLSGVECISAGICRGYVSEAQAVFCRSSRGERENLTETEVTLCGSCQSALASGRRRTDDAFSKIKANAFRTDAGTTDLEKRGKRQSPQLATREVGSGAWLGQRICGSDRQRMVAACLQNRRCRVGSEDCYRGWKCGQPTQAGLVHTEWVDVSSLLKSDGGNLDGRCSADGCVYNLGIERNHNYIANGILVSNCGQDEFTLEAKDAVEAR
ncbi:MAG: hypothetical protein KKF27_20105, partial [Gammaproteobacteria bacterium]|nr:hypothetical protein [Gammaproteobacteria bacterium]